MATLSDDKKNIFPCTIVSDRYSGAYSHGAFLAFPLDACEIPEEVGDDDVTCMNFWYEYKGIVGKGSTPQEAHDDLVKQAISSGVGTLLDQHKAWKERNASVRTPIKTLNQITVGLFLCPIDGGNQWEGGPPDLSKVVAWNESTHRYRVDGEFGNSSGWLRPDDIADTFEIASENDVAEWKAFMDKKHEVKQ